MDRIDPIRPRPPGAEPIPAIRRTKRSGEEREQPDPEGREKRRRPTTGSRTSTCASDPGPPSVHPEWTPLKEPGRRADHEA